MSIRILKSRDLLLEGQDFLPMIVMVVMLGFAYSRFRYFSLVGLFNCVWRHAQTRLRRGGCDPRELGPVMQVLGMGTSYP